jgi:hypothetical protein
MMSGTSSLMGLDVATHRVVPLGRPRLGVVLDQLIADT